MTPLSFCIQVSDRTTLSALIPGLIETVFRTDVQAPGFALLRFEETLSSRELRESMVQLKLFIGDYSKCARDSGLSPRDFLDQYNPMFRAGAERLIPYVVSVDCFEAAASQILLINNSSHALDGKGLQGVMHQAIVNKPDPTKRRIVNSTMLAVASSPEMFTAEQQQHFINCETISEAIQRY